MKACPFQSLLLLLLLMLLLLVMVEVMMESIIGSTSKWRSPRGGDYMTSSRVADSFHACM